MVRALFLVIVFLGSFMLFKPFAERISSEDLIDGLYRHSFHQEPVCTGNASAVSEYGLSLEKEKIEKEPLSWGNLTAIRP